MSRYLERAEHTARLLDVNLAQMLDQTPETAEPRWQRLLTSLLLSRPNDLSGLLPELTTEPTNPARENARQVREQISSEMWEQLNRFYLSIRRLSQTNDWQSEPHEFYRAVKEGSHLFQGITDATLSHGEGWHFIQIGRSIERAGSTAVLLDTHFQALAEPQAAETLDYLDWVGLLKSCTAFEAYCKVYTADLQPARVVEFLLLNAEFPRSVRFCVDTIQMALQAIAGLTGQRSLGRVGRLAGRLRAALDYAQIDEIMDDSMHHFLADMLRQFSQIHTAIHQVYIAYPVDAALTAELAQL
jgi:uncharacterized alpha-E superfamily protein